MRSSDLFLAHVRFEVVFVNCYLMICCLVVNFVAVKFVVLHSTLSRARSQTHVRTSNTYTISYLPIFLPLKYPSG